MDFPPDTHHSSSYAIGSSTVSLVNVLTKNGTRTFPNTPETSPTELIISSHSSAFGNVSLPPMHPAPPTIMEASR
ncbi:hypothetical protein WG66_008783 [Moniliophthora roreri]|nr:hypothetical protein WG66_008783 [Moniliophthora roreri]